VLTPSLPLLNVIDEALGRELEVIGVSAAGSVPNSLTVSAITPLTVLRYVCGMRMMTSNPELSNG
jgi:hypothetical protein